MKTSLRTTLFIPALSALLVAGIHTGAQAEIYKWKDANGNMQYTQTPPPASVKADNIAEDIKMAAGQSSTPRQSTKQTGKQKNEEDDDIAKARAEGESKLSEHAEFCKQQKNTLKQLLASPVIRWKDQDGERVLTAKQRRNKIADFEKTVKTMCNDEILDEQKKTDSKQ